MGASATVWWTLAVPIVCSSCATAHRTSPEATEAKVSFPRLPTEMSASHRRNGINSVLFRGHWEYVKNRADGRYEGGSARSFHAGDSMTILIAGNRFKIYGVLGKNGGPGALIMPDRPETTISFYAPQKETHRLVFDSGTLAGNIQSASLVVMPPGNGRKNGYVNIDEIYVPANPQKRLFYSFNKAHGDGIAPSGDLIAFRGRFYGSTNSGGQSSACVGGCGTVFSLSPSGVERVLYSFGSYAGDGTRPIGGLSEAGGMLYGTTTYGGSSATCRLGCGTVFSVTQDGKEKVLYSFGTYEGDGAAPQAGLIVVGRALYGTTQLGGTHDHGTIFSVTTDGVEKTLYSFGSYKTDGAYPVAALIDVFGTVYGTTLKGGVNDRGTLFLFDLPNGKELTLHDFGAGIDGSYPDSGVALSGSKLYGTTRSGGKYGTGVIYVSSLSGAEKTLYDFGASKDGAQPDSSLTRTNGSLIAFYGVTAAGGENGRGTLYEINNAGVETVLNSFGGSDGAYPYGRPLSFNGKFYGTTLAGGSGSCSGPQGNGCGTVFELTP